MLVTSELHLVEIPWHWLDAPLVSISSMDTGYQETYGHLASNDILILIEGFCARVELIFGRQTCFDMKGSCLDN